MALPVILAAIQAGLQYSASQQAADAQQSALDTATAQTRQGARQQAAATGQALELSRPLVQTRDNALNVLQTLFNLPRTAASNIAPTPGFGGTSGAQLVSLPGVRVVDQRGKKDSTGPIDFLGAFSKGGRQEVSSQAFYDPSRGVFVDEFGSVVASRPGEGGVIAGLTHGSDNQVRVGADGKLYSVGSRGEIEIGSTLPSIQAGGGGINEAAGSQFIPEDRNALVSMLMNTPGVQFVDDQGRRELDRMFAARGLRRSGAAYEAGIDRAAGQASTNYTNLVLNPLFQLAGFGNSGTGVAAGAIAGAGNNARGTSNDLAELALQSGNARASSFERAGQIGSSLADTLAGLYERNRADAGKVGSASASRSTAGGNPLASLYINRDPITPLPDNALAYGGN